MNLLLLSNSTNEGGYLHYALAAIDSLAAGRRRAAFVPFAGVTRHWDDYAHVVQSAVESLSIVVTPVHKAADPRRVLLESELLIVGGGNTFHLLHHCRRLRLLGAIREAVFAGTPYLGWSAGANVACPTICTTNDMPIIDPGGLDALGLIPFQINPHYSNALPPGIRGETRNQRLAEFTRLRPEMPVLCLPEGNWVRSNGERRELCGAGQSWWFRGSMEPQPVSAGPLDIPA
jgi:dipeptidase E